MTDEQQPVEEWEAERAAERERAKVEAKDRELAELKRRNKALATRTTELEELLERFSFIKPEDTRTPKWLRPKRAAKTHRATAVLMLSDLHLDERVDKYEMDGVNEFNREIAHRRWETVINKAVDLLKRYTAGVHYDGIVTPFLGDNVTGIIHDELERTNEAPVSETIAHWVPHLCAGLTYLADELGRAHVPCVDGNHDRSYKKIPAKQRATSSLAWIIYNWMADHLREDDRITFSITPSTQQILDVYDTTFLLDHGDGFRSQGGVGGLYPAMLKWLLRMHQFYADSRTFGRDFDYALLGHWHQDLYGQDFVVNASLKGYDEYARRHGFTYGVAAQQLFTVTPERGIGQRLTVHAD